MTGVNSERLRLFFLSILWRSLKTRIKEFSYLPNIGVDLDRIGRMIITKDSGDFGYHPIALDQISTLGFAHNHSPTIQEITFEFEDGTRKVEFYRLYMQGIVAHIYPESCTDLTEKMAALFVGGHEKLWVYARKFEFTRQFKEANFEIESTSLRWPGAV